MPTENRCARRAMATIGAGTSASYKHEIRLAQTRQGATRQQLRVPGPGAHQRHVSNRGGS